MTTFERTTDMELVRDILTDPRCWRRMTDDQAPAPDAFEPTLRTDLDYVVAREDGNACALFLLLHRRGFTEVHFCFCPAAWGKRTTEIARAFIAWVWASTLLTWLIGPVPSHNRLALRLAAQAGFTEFCREKRAGRRQGRHYDRILMQVQRPSPGAAC